MAWFVAAIAALRKFYRQHTKTDRIDARVLARMPLVDDGLHELVLPDAGALALKRLVVLRNKLVGEAVKVADRVRSTLCAPIVFGSASEPQAVTARNRHRRSTYVRGTELLGDVLRACPTAMIAIYSALDPDAEEAEALRAGAFTSYEKHLVTQVLAEVLREDYALFQQALAGEDVCTRSALDRRLAMSGPA